MTKKQKIWNTILWITGFLCAFLGSLALAAGIIVGILTLLSIGVLAFTGPLAIIVPIIAFTAAGIGFGLATLGCTMLLGAGIWTYKSNKATANIISPKPIPEEAGPLAFSYPISVSKSNNDDEEEEEEEEPKYDPPLLSTTPPMCNKQND